MGERKSFSVGVRVFSFVLLASSSMLVAGCMSIQAAAKKGDVGCVKMWLAVGVSPNSNFFWLANTPLIEAAANGRIEVVKLLLEKGADVNGQNEGGETPLHYAARGGHVKVMEILLDHGADPTKKGTGCGTPMQWAGRGGQIESIKVLMRYGVSLNQRGSGDGTALHVAVTHNHADTVRFLLENGAEVYDRFEYGCTPLFTAVCKRNMELARLLLEYGAKANLKCNGRTALIASVLNDDAEMTEMLLSFGADVNAKSDYDSTPLYISYKRNNVEIGRILLTNGADPTIECNGCSVSEEFLNSLERDEPKDTK